MALPLLGSMSALALQLQGGDQALDLGGLGVSLAGSISECAAVGVDVLAHIVLLGQGEQLADVVRALGAAHAWDLTVGQTGELLLTLLHDDQVEDRQVRADNATAHGLPPALALSAPMSKHAWVARGHEQPDTQIGHHTLPHGETLLVLATHDLEDVALELLAKSVTLDLLCQALVKESAQLSVVINLHLLLSPSGRVCNVELHSSSLQLHCG
mmetsp:Transcript_25586/g.71551  ORF Transcript_25586/g.71551 Transcript_25586/m.71551 type:complete len:213 (-) Transcript_25586:112-750(-)